MAFTEINEEQKVNISISTDAYAVLENDMAVIQINSKTTFINKLLYNFMNKAEASITKSKEIYKCRLQDMLNMKELTNKLKKENISATEATNIVSQVIDTLTDNYGETVKTKKYFCQKAKSFKIRLNKENYEYLITDCEENLNYFDSIGAYISTLIEEYCSKPYVKREKIYNNEIFNDIETACNVSSIITLKMKNKQKITIKPYKIVTDKLSMYHYIIGYSVTPDNYTNEPDKTFSCRITHIDSVENRKQTFSLTQKEISELNDALHDKGAQFMCEDISEHTIYLTDRGIALYKRMLHLRPRCSNISGNGHIYTFRCSRKQIEFYFFKFGAEAVILSPDNARNDFIERYSEALNSYKHISEQLNNI